MIELKKRQELVNLCIRVVSSIINENYIDIRNMGALNRVSEEDIKRVLSEYCRGDCTLTPLPIDAFNEKSFHVSKDSVKSGYEIGIDLWIDNRLSDLTLQLSVETDESDNIMSYLIEDLHAM